MSIAAALLVYRVLRRASATPSSACSRSAVWGVAAGALALFVQQWRPRFLRR